MEMEGGGYIPVIDISPLALHTSADSLDKPKVKEQLSTTWSAVDKAVREVGFMYISDAPTPSVDLRHRMFDLSRRFFAKSYRGAKLAWARTAETDNVGYVGLEWEKLDPKKEKGDLKEAFNIARPRQMVEFWSRCQLEKSKRAEEKEKGSEKKRERDGEVSTSGSEADEMTMSAEEEAEFKEIAEQFFLHCEELARCILRAFAMALGLPASFFDDRLATQRHTLRLLHYPPLPSDVAEAAFTTGQQTRAGEHSDYGCITLLFQDDVGGFEVRKSDGDWVDAPCIPDTVVVNTGDLMQRWTNDLYVSTRHRVGIPPDREKRGRHRYSIAFFVHPDDETDITPLDACVSEETRPRRYEPITAGEYLQQRLSATY